MPKVVYDNFLGGIAPFSDRVGPVGSYAEGRDVDPHRKPGYIKPGFAETELANSVDDALIGLILDATFSTATSGAYAIDDTRLYELTSVATTFTADGNWPHAVTNGKGVFFYPCKTGGTSASRLFYLTTLDIGLSNPATPDFDDDWGSTTPAGAGALQSAPHPSIEWNTFRWIGNGRYLAKLDGQTGNDGTIELTKLDLGIGWEITALFPTRNFVGICAWRKMSSGSSYRTESRVFFYDGASSSFAYSIPVEDNYIMSAINLNGIIYLITDGRSFGSTLRVLTDSGAEAVRSLKFNMAGGSKYFIVGNHNTMDVFQNRLLIGAPEADYMNAIFTYGSTTQAFQKALFQPYSSASDPSANGAVGFVGHLFLGSIFMSSYDGTKYYWSRFPGNASANAFWKGLYTDPGVKVRINYIKYFFDPLASGDDITPTLDIDYGTSVPLVDIAGNANLSHANDGIITSKKYSVKRDCIAFRPCIAWTAGDTAFSKMVIDYDTISDV